MTEPGYPGASTPDPNAPQAPGVPGQFPPPQPNYGSTPPPPPGYGAPQAPFTPVAPPPGYASSDDKTWALVAHFGGAVGAFFCGMLSFVAPLVAYLVKRDSSPTVRQHAANALNFQIIISAITIVLYIIRVIAYSSITTSGFAFGTLLLLVQWVVAIIGVVFAVIGGIRANEGIVYKYPVSLGLIK